MVFAGYKTSYSLFTKLNIFHGYTPCLIHICCHQSNSGMCILIVHVHPESACASCEHKSTILLFHPLPVAAALQQCKTLQAYPGSGMIA